jgi:hypothetical protein
MSRNAKKSSVLSMVSGGANQLRTAAAPKQAGSADGKRVAELQQQNTTTAPMRQRTATVSNS